MAVRQRDDKARQQAYQTVLSTDAGRIVMQDLVPFAQHCEDPIRAAGRMDVILRFLREEYRAMQKDNQPEEEE